MPEAKKLERYKSILGIYSALRNYPKVIDYGNRALKVSRDPDLQVAVAQGLLPVRRQTKKPFAS
jgi:hypothetical protein